MTVWQANVVSKRCYALESTNLYILLFPYNCAESQHVSMTVWQADGVSRPDATTNMASTFRELLTTLEDGGYMYPPDIEYDGSLSCNCSQPPAHR